MKKKEKNWVLKMITNLAIAEFIIACCFIDSAGWIPSFIALLSGAWIALFTYANREELFRYENH